MVFVREAEAGVRYGAQRVALPDGREAWTLLGPDLAEVEPAAGFLRFLHRSPHPALHEHIER